MLLLEAKLYLIKKQLKVKVTMLRVKQSITSSIFFHIPDFSDRLYQYKAISVLDIIAHSHALAL